MTTYRTGNHWGVTIVREGEADHTWRPFNVGNSVCAEADCSFDEPEHPGLVAVVVNGDQDLAERICALLNGDTGQDSERIALLSRQVTELRRLLEASIEDSPCEHFNHHGECETHGNTQHGQCMNAAALAYLAETAPAELGIEEAGPRPHDQERADVARRINEQAEHRPSSPGSDGLGYGPCTGCGQFWPCAQSRRECP